MKLTYIYVKESPLGLLYLGKTEQDPYKYKGSGKNWKKHLKDNRISNSDVNTYILHSTEDKEDLEKIGKFYSNLFNVVESAKWANMKMESGEGGTDKGHLKGIKKPKHSLNMTGSGNPMYGKKFSKESREKMRLAQLGKYVGSKSKIAKKVNQYEKDGTFIKTWGSIVDVERELGIHHQHISKVCRGERNHTGGFKWKYS
jgi:hypothetical protein